jgi:hypothetical protein
MKTLYKKVLGILLLLALLVGCTKNFDEINTDPNNPEMVATGFIFTYVEKNIMDNLRDEWAGGRMFFSLAQYWSQINYTDEDRYAHRSTVTDAWWRAMYTAAMNLETIIKLNTDEATKTDALASGANENQIAAAKILKVYIFSVLTDAFGDVPYSEAFLAQANRQPKYDAQSEIYPKLLMELQEAWGMINLDAPGILTGDIIYGGDMMKWKKFAASLGLRIAQRMGGRDGGTSLEAIIGLATVDGFFTSNDDNAKFAYVGAGDNGPLYDAWFTEARNDFTLSKPFVTILQGENDDLNGKTNPFFGLVDPRLPIFAGVEGYIYGMPYGMTDAETKAFAPNCPDFNATPPSTLDQTFAYTFMDYAEVCFILSEYYGWDQAWYEKGVRASMEDWGCDPAAIDAFVSAMPGASQETVLTQKYIALYIQGEQGWMEYRRSGFPKMLIKPGQQTNTSPEGDPIYFEPLEGDGIDIPSRILYAVEEYNINNGAVKAAALAIGGDLLDTKVWWDTGGK